MRLPRDEMTHDIEGMGLIGGWLARNFVSTAMPQHLASISHAFGLGKYDVETVRSYSVRVDMIPTDKV